MSKIEISKKQKFETLEIKYRAPKEHIEQLKKAAAGVNLETFFKMCVIKYLETFYWPKCVDVPEGLLRQLRLKALELDMTPDNLAIQLLVKGLTDAPKA